MAEKKEKITYVDDGRTIADMSGVPDYRPEKRHPATPHPKFKDAWNTYWAAVKMMIMPMCVVLAIITVLFLLLMWMASGA